MVNLRHEIEEVDYKTIILKDNPTLKLGVHKEGGLLGKTSIDDEDEIVVRGTLSETGVEGLSCKELLEYIINEHHSYFRNHVRETGHHLHALAVIFRDENSGLKKVEELYEDLSRVLEEIIKIEEVVLYPRIKVIEEQYFGARSGEQMVAIKSIIKVLNNEFEEGLGKLVAIRKLTDNFISPDTMEWLYDVAFGELRDLETNIMEEFYLEKRVLFPKAMDMINKIILNYYENTLTHQE